MTTCLYKQKQQAHLSTLGMFKLSMRNVNKCKILAVRSRHVEVGLCLVDILNSKDGKEGKTNSVDTL